MLLYAVTATNEICYPHRPSFDLLLSCHYRISVERWQRREGACQAVIAATLCPGYRSPLQRRQTSAREKTGTLAFSPARRQRGRPFTSPFRQQLTPFHLVLHHVIRPSYHSLLTWSAQPLDTVLPTLDTALCRRLPSSLIVLLVLLRLYRLLRAQTVTCSRLNMRSRL